MTQEEYLLDTLEYYSVDRKTRTCRIAHVCKYSPLTISKTREQSEGCAIGRKLDPEVAKEWDERGAGCSISSIKKYHPDLFAKAPEWMQKMDMNFLSEVQMIHDTNSYIDEEGVVNENGKTHLKSLLQQFNISEEKFQKFI